MPGSETMMMSFPASLIPTLTLVVSFLRTLPLPSTHPSHPAAPVILSTPNETQKGYADMRRNWNVKCLEGQGERLVARAEMTDFFDNQEGIYRMGRVNSEVCDCQVIVYLNLIICLTGRVRTFG